jgi:hypothetical protein
MAGAIVQSAYAVDDSGSPSTTIAVTINGVTAGNTLAVQVGYDDTEITDNDTSVSGINDGTAYTNTDGPRRDAGNAQSSHVWRKENSGSGNFTVTATFNRSAPFRRIRVCELSGLETTANVDQTAGQGQTTPGTGTDAVTSGSTSTTANANDFLVGFSQDTSEADPGTGTLSAGTSYTISGTNVMLGLESRSVSATGTYAATFTQSVNNNRTTHIVAFKEAAGGGGGQPPRSMHQYRMRRAA